MKTFIYAYINTICFTFIPEDSNILFDTELICRQLYINKFVRNIKKLYKNS